MKAWGEAACWLAAAVVFGGVLLNLDGHLFSQRDEAALYVGTVLVVAAIALRAMRTFGRRA